MPKVLVATLVLVVAVIAVLVIFSSTPRTPGDGFYDTFAACLSDNDIVMYGAYWCPHCQNEKKRFGDSFRFVSYVECTEETEKCTAEKIRGYPTWAFPDGRRFEGEMGLERLSAESGCELPKQQ